MNEKDFCVSVGIVHAKEIEFILNNSYLAGQQTVKGLQRAYCSEQGICWDGRIYHEIVGESILTTLLFVWRSIFS